MIKRNRRKTVPCCCPVDIQQLESRQLLTGTVTVAVSKAGDISVSGDSKDNDVFVEVNADNVTIVGNSGTSLKVGKTVIAPGVPVVVPRPASIRDLDVNLHGGNDSIDISVNSDVVIHRNVNVWTGAGNDSVSVESNGALVDVRGSVSMNTGSGHDSVRVADADKFAGVDTEAELLAVADDTGAASVQMIRVGKDINISTGTGNDGIALLGVEAGRDVTVNSGLGHGDVLGVSNVRAGRDMNLIWGDLNAINNVTIVRKLRVDSGTGNDRFVVDNLHASIVDVNLGPGNDQLAIGGTVVVTKSAKIHGGAGKDNLVSLSPLGGASVKSFEGSVVDAAAILDEVLAALV